MASIHSLGAVDSFLPQANDFSFNSGLELQGGHSFADLSTDFSSGLLNGFNGPAIDLGTPQDWAAPDTGTMDNGMLSSLRSGSMWMGGLSGLATIGAYALAPELGLLTGAMSLVNFMDSQDTVGTLYNGEAARQIGNSYSDGFLIGLNGGAFATTAPSALVGAVGAGGFGYGTTQGLLDGKSFGDAALGGLWSGVQAWGVANLQNPISGKLGSLGDLALPATRFGLWAGSNALTQDALNADVDWGRVAQTGFGGSWMTPIGAGSKGLALGGSSLSGSLNAFTGGIGSSIIADKVGDFFGGVTSGGSFMNLDLGNTYNDQVYPY